MARDGSGTYALPQPPIAFGERPAGSSKMNAQLADLASEMTDSFSRSGKGAALADLSMGGFKLENVGTPVDPGDVATKGYVDSVIGLPNPLLVNGGTQENGEPFVVATSALGGTGGDERWAASYHIPDNNETRLVLKARRLTNGSSHDTALTVLQRRVDVTNQGYLGFGSSASGTLAWVLGYGTTGTLFGSDDQQVGLGGQPSASWVNGRRALEFVGSAGVGVSLSMPASGSNILTLVSNAIDDGGAWRFTANGAAVAFNIGNGAFDFYRSVVGTAGNPVSFLLAMTIAQAGNISMHPPASGDHLTLVTGGAQQTTMRLYQAAVGEWYIGMSSGSTVLRIGAGAGMAADKLNLDTSGNMTVTGQMTATQYNISSLRSLKTNITPIQPGAVGRILGIPLYEFEYKSATVKRRHVGSMVDDISSRYGVDGMSIDTTAILYDLVAAVQDIARHPSLAVPALH